jgi:hypothetical protein
MSTDNLELQADSGSISHSFGADFEQSSPPHHMPAYFYWESGDATAVYAIESSAPYDGDHPPRISRRYRNENFLHEDVGRLLGCGLGRTHVALIKATAGDLITLFETIRGEIHPTTFRVNFDHTLEIIVEGPIIGEARILTLLNHQQPHYQGRLRINEKDLEILFHRHCPDWLKEILNSQLAFWRIHHVEHYFHYCPLDISSKEIFRGVKGSPLWVLARFGRRLNSMQRTLCCKRTPFAPIFLPWGPMALGDRRWKLGLYPSEILKYAADRFDVDDLAFCAQLQPLVALEYRHYLDQKKQDAVLSGMASFFTRDELGLYPMGWKKEIPASIARDPSLWVRTFDYDFSRLFSVMRTVLAIHQDGRLTQMLAECLEGKELEAFQHYLCSQV